MEASTARKGIEETEKVYQLFQQLLQSVGNGNLMFDKSKNSDPASVPMKCEQNNIAVAELLENMKKSLSEVKQCYNTCQTEMSSNTSNMPCLEDLANKVSNEMEIEKTQECLNLRKQLQAKNADLKFIIDEVRQIFSDINQLSTSVPY